MYLVPQGLNHLNSDASPRNEYCTLLLGCMTLLFPVRTTSRSGVSPHFKDYVRHKDKERKDTEWSLWGACLAPAIASIKASTEGLWE